MQAKLAVSLVALILFAKDVLSQNGTAMYDEKPLIEKLAEFETTYDLQFSYDPDLLFKIYTPDLKLKKRRDWKPLLTKLLGSTQLTYEVLQKKYILIKSDKESNQLFFDATVRDIESKEPLPYATLQFIKSKQGFQSDQSGKLSFYYSKTEPDSVEIRFIGYETIRTTISQLGKTIPMSSSLIELDDVLVADQSLLAMDFDNVESRFTLNPKQIQLQAGWGEPDLLRMTQMLPGIHSSDETAASLNVRGGTPDQNLILWDGIPVFHSGYFFGMLSAFNPYVVDEINIYKGGFDASHGGRVASIIDIQTQDRPYEEARFGAGFNMINWHAFAKIPLFKRKFSFTFSTRNSLSERLQNQTLNRFFNRLFQTGKIAEYNDIEEVDLLNKNESSFHLNEISSRLHWHWKKEGDGLSFSYFKNNDAFGYEFEVDQPWITHATNDQFRNTNEGYHLNLKKQVTKKWKTEFGLLNSLYFNEYSSVFTADLDDLFHARGNIANRINNTTIRWLNKIQFHPNHHLELGYSLNYWDLGLNIKYEQIWSEEDQKIELELPNLVYTSYFNYAYTSPNKTQLKIGLRHNTVRDERISYWEPRYSISYPIPNSFWTLKSRGGNYVQYISQVILTNDLGVGDRIWATAGVENIPVMESNDITLGASYQNDGLQMNFEAYAKRTEGLSKLNFANSRQETQGFSEGNSMAAGIEIMLQKKWNNYRTFLSYNFSSVQYQFKGFNGDQLFSPIHDQPHILRLGHLYSLKNWEFILNGHLYSGNPYSIGDQITENKNETTGENYYSVNYTDENSGRFGLYKRVDLNIQKKWLINKVKLTAGVSWFNLFNSNNEIKRHYYIYFPDNNTNPDINYFNEIGLNRTINIFARVEF